MEKSETSGMLEFAKTVVQFLLSSVWTRCKGQDSESGHFMIELKGDGHKMFCKYCGKGLQY